MKTKNIIILVALILKSTFSVEKEKKDTISIIDLIKQYSIDGCVTIKPKNEKEISPDGCVRIIRKNQKKISLSNWHYELLKKIAERNDLEDIFMILLREGNNTKDLEKFNVGLYGIFVQIISNPSSKEYSELIYSKLQNAKEKIDKDRL